jgi:hypothetical protein
MTHVMLRPPKPLRAYVRSLPAALDTLLRGCLAKEPGGRPSSAEAFAKELRGFMAPPPKTMAAPVRRPRKKSEPLPLVKKSGGGAIDPPLHSEPALPLVTRSGPPSSEEPRKAVLELVGDEENVEGSSS